MSAINWAQARTTAAAPADMSTPVAPGNYHVRVKEATVGQNNRKQDTINVRLEIIAPASTGRLLFDDIAVAGPNDENASRTMGFFFHKLASLGLPDEFFQANPEVTLDQLAAYLVSREAHVTVVNNAGKGTNSGKTYANVGWYTTVGTTPLKVDPVAPQTVSHGAYQAPAAPVAQAPAAPAPAPQTAPAPAPAAPPAAPQAAPATGSPWSTAPVTPLPNVTPF